MPFISGQAPMCPSARALLQECRMKRLLCVVMLVLVSMATA